MPREMNIPV